MDVVAGERIVTPVVYQPHRQIAYPTRLLHGGWIVYPYEGLRSCSAPAIDEETFGHSHARIRIAGRTDAAPGSTKRWAVHVEGVWGQRYVRWERYISGYYRAYFCNIYSTGLNILIAIHSWKLRMCLHWARTLGRALKMGFRNRKRKAWLDRWPSRTVDTFPHITVSRSRTFERS